MSGLDEFREGLDEGLEALLDRRPRGMVYSYQSGRRVRETPAEIREIFDDVEVAGWAELTLCTLRDVGDGTVRVDHEPYHVRPGYIVEILEFTEREWDELCNAIRDKHKPKPAAAPEGFAGISFGPIRFVGAQETGAGEAEFPPDPPKDEDGKD
jgi:hypothetical protein